MQTIRAIAATILILCASVAFAANPAIEAGPGTAKLIAHWKLNGDTLDSSGNGLNAENHGVTFEAAKSGPLPTHAKFNGRGQFLTVPDAESLNSGADDFSISLWVHTEKDLDDDIGDLISKFDSRTRTGFQLGVRNHTGVTTSSPNARELEFSLDAGTEPTWVDLGRPGGERSILPFALANFRGNLFAATCEPGKDAKGDVYNLGYQNVWEPLKVPHLANSVSSLTVFNEALYAGTAKYRVAGSALAESENTNLGGQIFRYNPARRTWSSCGRLPNTEGIGGMTVYKGRLYASSLYRPAGFFRYEGGETWTSLATPNGKRTESLGVFNGYLWATGYDEGHIYRFDGETWTDMGGVGDNTQTYSFAIHEGKLCVGTWPSGKVFRLDDKDQWEDIGRLGEELEVMGMLVHNGKLYAGTLPLAEVYRYDGGQTWTRIKQLDTTENVKYRRAWTMTQHAGKLMCGVLPSGRVHAMKSGHCVQSGFPLADGWRHIVVIKIKESIQVYWDGVPIGNAFDIPVGFNISNGQPLHIGKGSGDTFHGRMSDVRLYRGWLGRDEINRLSQQRFARLPVKQIVGHAGASARFPENSLAGYRAAWTQGATCIEIDVRMTKDRELVPFHDATVDRTSNAKGKISEMTWDQIKGLDIGSWKGPQFSDETPWQVGFLMAMFRSPQPLPGAKVPPKPLDILLDLKEEGDEYLSKVVEAVKTSGNPAHTIFGVRSVNQAKTLRKLMPQSRQLGLIAVPDDIEPYAAAGVDMIRLWPKWLSDESLVPRVRKAGVKLHLNGTTGAPEETIPLLRYQPDSLSSDDPERLIETLLAL